MTPARPLVPLGLVAALLCAAAVAQTPPADRATPIEALVASGKLEDAVEACNAWVKEDAQATKPHFLLSEVHIRLKNWDRAQEELEIVIDLNPASSSAHVKLGDLLRGQRKFGNANEQYHKALDVNPRCVEAFLGLVRAALEANKPEDADAALETLVGIAPDNPAVLALAGEMANRAGKPAEAAAKFKLALDKDPKCADALYGIAVLVQAQGTAAAEAEAQKYWDQFLAAETETDRAWQVRYGLVILGRREVPKPICPDERPDISPDARLVATIVPGKGPDDKLAGVWVTSLDGAGVRTQIATGGGASSPRWTADGKSVLFDFRYDPKSPKTRTFIAPADGKQPPVCLTPEANIARIAGPVPGTDRIAYSDAWSFWTMKLDGSDRQRLPTASRSNVEVMWPRLSPDGKSVVYQSTDWDDKRNGGCLSNIVTAPLDGSRPPRRLTDEYDPATRAGNTHPAWGPDGKRVCYLSDEDDPKRNFYAYVRVIGDPHPALRLGTRGFHTWFPDGTKILANMWLPSGPGGLLILELGGKRLPVVKPQPAGENR